jgi:polysaccharide pyruvyl transferase WcaK-like protein
VRLHLGHHFYGAGNLGDDFMLAGFLGAMRTLAPRATFSCCVPFALDRLQRRFPAIEWLPCESAARARCIAACDFWLGLGGSPFQSAQSRWFVDHLAGELEMCTGARKPMFFLGVGVQSANELADPEVRRICAGAAGIWTRDPASAKLIRALPSAPPVDAASDLAHLFFRETRPPPAVKGRLTVVANFDYDAWPGQASFLAAARKLSALDHVWLAQESRDLPGAERALFTALPPDERTRWRFVSPETPGANLADVFAHWPSGEWLVTARYHAALAGAWAGSKIVVLSTNEKLRAAAHELHAPLISPAADEGTVLRALTSAIPAGSVREHAQRAYSACEDLLRSAVAHRR